MKSTPHWKRIWIALNGKRTHIGPNGASSALQLAKRDLLVGICMYQPYTEQSYMSCMENIIDLSDPDFKSLIQRTSLAMNLDACTCWAMICNYLKFECFVQVEDLNNIQKYIMNQASFITDIWQFYTLERMYMLNTLNWIIQKCRNKGHDFCDIYRKFVDEVSIQQIQNNLFKQFSALLKEINYETRSNCVEICAWVERNCREQLQVVFAILNTLVHQRCDIFNFLHLLRVFKEKNTSARFYPSDAKAAGRLYIVQFIKDIQIVIFLSSLETFWDNYDVWYNHYREIDGYIKEIYKNWNSPVVLLAWVALHLTIPSNIASSNFASNVQSYLQKALGADVFTELHELVSNDLFKNTFASIMVKKSIFIVVEVLCIKLGADRIYDHQGTVILVGKLLRTPEIAVVWHEGSDEGAKSFYNRAVSLFPFHFQPLSFFVKSLISLRFDAESVVLGLSHLQLFTDKCRGLEDLGPPGAEKSLTIPYSPINTPHFVFPVGTKMTISKVIDQSVITFHTPYSYFKVLWYTLDVLFKQIESNTYHKNTEEAVIIGYKVMLEILKINYGLFGSDTYVTEIFRLAGCLLYAITKPRMEKYSLVEVAFEVLVRQLDLKPLHVITHLTDMKFIPVVVKDVFSLQDFCQAQYLSHSHINNLISKDLFSPFSCKLISLYIKLITKAIKNKLSTMKVIIPGLMFLIVKLFPIFAKEFTTINIPARNVFCKLVKLIHYILTKETNNLPENELVYVNCVLDLFLQKKLHIGTLCSVCGIGNVRLEIILSGETNYDDGPILKLVKVINRTLSCFVHILKFIHLYSKIERFATFEEMLCQHYYDARFLKTVAGYISHSCDEEIPILACQILAYFASVSRVPILQALDFNNVDVRHWIMECFRDQLLNNKIKVCVVQFIKCCIYEQTSMIAAFFNIHSESDIVPDQESVLDCMADYLKNIEQNTGALAKPLQIAILELFHIFWKTNKQGILKKITEEENFWKLFTTPLLKVEGVPPDVNIFTFEILIMEMCLKKEVNPHFKSAIDHMYELNNRFTEIWINRVVEITKVNYLNQPRTGTLPLSLILLSILKKFILITYHLYPNHKLRWKTYTIQLRCLDTLLYCLLKSEDKRLVTVWAEYCLLFYLPEGQTLEQMKEYLNIINYILVKFSESYTRLDYSCQVTILTLTSKVLAGSEIVMLTNSTFVTPFLLPFVKILEYEFRNIMSTEAKKVEKKDEKFYYNWVLIIKMINTFLKLELIGIAHNFFIRTFYIEKLLEVIRLFVQSYLPVRVAEVTVQSLIHYAETPYSRHFDHFIKNINSYMFPNFPCVVEENKLLTERVPEQLTNYWRVYSHLMRLNGVLLNQRGSFVARDMLLFIECHQTIIRNGVLTATMIANEDNLYLVCNILHFIYAALKYYMIWPDINREGFLNIMTSVKEVLNMSAHVLLSPNILVVSSPSQATEGVCLVRVPQRNLISITNLYVEIITWGCMCLNRCNPSIINLLDVFQSHFELHVEYDFRVPPPMNVHQPRLTYNSLLCILHFLCKTLTQISIDESEIDVASTSKAEEENSKPLPCDCSVIIYPWNAKDIANSMTTLFGDILPKSAGLQTPWLKDLNFDNLLLALFALNTFLASQVFLTIRDTSVERNVMRYIRRELCSELLCYYDFVNNYLNHKLSPKGRRIVEADHMVSLQKSKFTLSDNIVTPIKQLAIFTDVTQVCCDRKGKIIPVQTNDDCFLLVLVHWFRHVCRLVHYSKFDEFLSQWHAKSTYVADDTAYVKNVTCTISDEDD